MEDPKERDRKFRERVYAVKDRCQKTKEMWSYPLRPYGFWTFERHNAQLAWDAKISQVPGRRDPYDDLLQDSYGFPKWMNSLKVCFSSSIEFKLDWFYVDICGVRSMLCWIIDWGCCGIFVLLVLCSNVFLDSCGVKCFIEWHGCCKVYDRATIGFYFQGHGN
jgi:hypothetical protein